METHQSNSDAVTEVFPIELKKTNQSPPKQSLISGTVDKLTMRADIFQMLSSFSLYFLSLWWEAIDQLVAWYTHIFCVWESVLMWLWSMCRGYLSRVSLLGSIKYWDFKRHLNTQCWLNDLSYPSQMLLHINMGNFFVCDLLSIKKCQNDRLTILSWGNFKRSCVPKSETEAMVGGAC